MWILSLIPTVLLDLIVNLTIVLGLAGIILSFFLHLVPLSINKTILQVISIILIVIGVYWKGGINVEKEWRAKVEAAETRAKVAEEKAATATAKVEYVFIDRVQKVRDVQVVVQERIRDLSVKIDENCKVVPEVIELHNQAARNALKK
jgi:hypothetical protein